MAGADPRRSSRARVTQPISSTSSSLSGRVERNSRHFKTGSPPKSTSTGSLSSEPPEDTITAEDTFGSRRRTRGQIEDRDRPATRTETIEMANGDDEIQEEDEAVRCICGYDDYPGPPPIDEESKHGLKDSTDLEPIFPTDLTDDAAGFFVQCDLCKVWQHGACVGIITEESSPDEYFCEQCRKDFHKTFTASNGQRFSHYLPLKQSSRAASRSASLNKDGARSPPKDKEGRESRSARASSSSQASKRRSTMNSREAAYDEAEALRRAIEASKEDAPVLELGDGGSRRAKRVRSDSEEKQESAKRQRTSSRSVSPSPGKTADDSDDDGATRNGTSKTRPRSSAAVRSQRVEKPSEREERERQRIEAANKRKGRAERRRADDSDPSEELPLAARAAASRTTTAASGAPKDAASATAAAATVPPTALAESTQIAAPEAPPPSQPTTDTPSPSVIPPTKNERKRSHKKKGRNQYTRDRDDEDSPARSQSRDIQKDDHAASGSNGKGGGDHTHTKSHAKSKGGMSSKVTLTDMKRKATALLDFITRTQVELAGETLPGTGSNTPKVNGSTTSATGSVKNLEVSGVADTAALARENRDAPRAEREFRELNCLEMMDSLTRRLVKWQQEYAAS